MAQGRRNLKGFFYGGVQNYPGTELSKNSADGALKRTASIKHRFSAEREKCEARVRSRRSHNFRDKKFLKLEKQQQPQKNGLNKAFYRNLQPG